LSRNRRKRLRAPRKPGQQPIEKGRKAVLTGSPSQKGFWYDCAARRPNFDLVTTKRGEMAWGKQPREIKKKLENGVNVDKRKTVQMKRKKEGNGQNVKVNQAST